MKGCSFGSLLAALTVRDGNGMPPAGRASTVRDEQAVFCGAASFQGDISFFYARKARNSVPRLCLLDSRTTGIFFKNMPLTFLKNIRLFNKKDHTPAHAHPNARTPLAVVESRQARESTLTTRTDTPPTRTGVGPNSLPSRKSAGPHAPQRARARPPEKRIAFTMSACSPTRTGGAHPKNRPSPENHPSPKE